MMENEPPKGGFAPIFRIVLYIIALVFILIVIGGIVATLIAVSGLAKFPDPPAIPPLPFLTIFTVALTPFVLLVTFAFVKFIDRRPVETLGFSLKGSWAKEIWFGLGLGIGIPMLMFVIFYLAGWSTITGSVLSSPSQAVFIFIQAILLMTAVSLIEETIARGYILQTLRWGYGSVIALIVSSALFGAGHLSNPGAEFSAFLGTTAAGLVLGYTYLITGRLWLPIAFHFTWNLALGPIFGFRVSGIEIPGWIEHQVEGPVFWTGGEFGPEAGIITLLILALSIPIIRWFAVKHYDSGTPFQPPEPESTDNTQNFP